MPSIHTQRTATHCNTLHHTAPHCNTLQHTAIHCTTLQHTATHCTTLQHNATHCNTLQSQTVDAITQHLLQSQTWRAAYDSFLGAHYYTITVCNRRHSIQFWSKEPPPPPGGFLSIKLHNTWYTSYTQGTVTLCTTLQHTAPHCTTLQHTAIIDTRYNRPHRHGAQPIIVIL